MTPTATREQLNKINAELGLSKLPLSEQDEISIQLHTVLFKSSLVHFLERLRPKERKAYLNLIEMGASPEECAAFFKSHKKTLDISVARAVSELADDILVDTP